MVVFVLLAAFILRTFLIQPFVVEGQSMEPSFHNQEYLILEKISYRLHGAKRGDIVIFQAPASSEVDYIKRVIGLPGETIKILKNSVYINGNKMNEPYLNENVKTLINQDPDMTLERTLGPNEYFVLGDNREHSSDSREFGAIDKSVMVGKVWISVFPWQYLEVVPHQQYGLR